MNCCFPSEVLFRTVVHDLRETADRKLWIVERLSNKCEQKITQFIAFSMFCFLFFNQFQAVTLNAEKVVYVI